MPNLTTKDSLKTHHPTKILSPTIKMTIHLQAARLQSIRTSTQDEVLFQPQEPQDKFLRGETRQFEQETRIPHQATHLQSTQDSTSDPLSPETPQQSTMTKVCNQTLSAHNQQDPQSSRSMDSSILQVQETSTQAPPLAHKMLHLSPTKLATEVGTTTNISLQCQPEHHPPEMRTPISTKPGSSLQTSTHSTQDDPPSSRTQVSSNLQPPQDSTQAPKSGSSLQNSQTNAQDHPLIRKQKGSSVQIPQVSTIASLGRRLPSPKPKSIPKLPPQAKNPPPLPRKSNKSMHISSLQVPVTSTEVPPVASNMLYPSPTKLATKVGNPTKISLQCQPEQHPPEVRTPISARPGSSLQTPAQSAHNDHLSSRTQGGSNLHTTQDSSQAPTSGSSLQSSQTNTQVNPTSSKPKSSSVHPSKTSKRTPPGGRPPSPKPKFMPKLAPQTKNTPSPPCPKKELI